MKKIKIGILGAGTVGVMSVCHYLKYLPKSEVTCIYNPNKNILGIGESSNINLPRLLWDSLNFISHIDGKELDLTHKFGVEFINWRPNNFFSPIAGANSAFHFNNFKLAEVLFQKCFKIYGERFKIIENDIEFVNDNLYNVHIKTSKEDLIFDYVVDCRGYPENYSEYTFADFLPLNTCFAYQILEPGTWQTTKHIATKNGWMFGIPLLTRQGWGYLFNDIITSKDEALVDMSQILSRNISIEDVKSFDFKPYRSNKFLNNRIIKNGNRALFFEPMEALSGVFYDNINYIFLKYIKNEVTENDVNDLLINIAKNYENFLCFAYHGGSIYNTKFWKKAVELTSNHLSENDSWKKSINGIKLDNDDVTWPYPPKVWKFINDTGWKYKYF